MFSKDIKKGFPTLVNDPGLVYLDSAASTQTHQSVLDRMEKYYTEQRCNVNRGDFKMAANEKSSSALSINERKLHISLMASSPANLNLSTPAIGKLTSLQARMIS